MKRFFLLSGFIISFVAVLGSLYFSEVKHFVPCTFCWYQRILMYPLPVLFAVAFIRKELTICYYTLPLSALGMGFALLHYLQQKTALFGETCRSIVPCSTMYINWGGFITIPFLSLIAFSLLTVVLLCCFNKIKEDR